MIVIEFKARVKPAQASAIDEELKVSRQRQERAKQLALCVIRSNDLVSYEDLGLQDRNARGDAASTDLDPGSDLQAVSANQESTHL